MLNVNINELKDVKLSFCHKFTLLLICNINNLLIKLIFKQLFRYNLTLLLELLTFLYYILHIAHNFAYLYMRKTLIINKL